MHSYIDLAQTVMQLSVEERERLFQLISENTDLFRKILPEVVDRLLLNDSSRDLPHPVSRHFNEWRDR
jgi:hypothetical protein